MFAAMIDSAPHYLPEDVIAALVAGQDAVGDRERRCAGVVGDDAAGKLLSFR